MIRFLEEVCRGGIDRLMILAPPGSAKSKYTSELFLPFWFANHPRTAAIHCSHTAQLADHFGRRVRNYISAYADTLGYGLAGDKKAAAIWETSSGGEYIAAGVGGTITGRRADIGLIDDPVKSKEDAESPTIREKTWNWYKNDFYTRLKPDARIVLIMTRWHEDDLGGRLLEEEKVGGDKWTVLKLPAFAEDANDPLGRQVGEALWPGWEDAAKLNRKRKVIGERDFGALYQQNPRPAGTSYFEVANCLVGGERNEEGYLIGGKPVAYPVRCDMVFSVVDTAVKTGTKNDGTGVIHFGYTRGAPIPLVILDWDIVQVDGDLLQAWLPQVIERGQELAKQTQARYGYGGSHVEDKASGSILIMQGKRRNWPVHIIDSKLTAVGKDERAISVSGYIAAQKVKLSAHAYDKVTNYKARNGNHLLIQVFRFVLGVKDQADDLLDCFCYGVAIALGDKRGI